ncbi:MAG: formyltetrahydrofolate deformylase [Gammaproteobacteria bacterium]|nr:MAG: formyltetrahydrofolate deformylase [Gammaproteobacteria bacterium]
MINDTTARLLITCPDKPGIVSAVTTFFYNHGANITMLDQHSSDPEGGTFFMRLEFQTPHLDIERKTLEQIFAKAVAEKFDMNWRLSYASDTKKLAVLVSRYDHALLELLWRNKRGELPADITMVISNHSDLGNAVGGFGIPFHHIPVTSDNRASAESEILKLLEGQADLVVLARYMQILSNDFVSKYPNKIINIHHSFLPAFAGADPYRKACERGVKLIGATAHYVTTELDEGPIIEQDTNRVSHRQNADEMKEIGMNIERIVLARAVKWHLEDKIIIHGNRTVVFT